MTDSRNSFSYLSIIAKRWWLFLLLPIITSVAIFIISGTSEPEYMAYERLQIIPGDPLQVSLFSRTPTLTTAQQIQSVHDDFYDVIRRSSVAWKTIADLNLNISAAELLERLNTQHVGEFITISVRMNTPEQARDVVSTLTQNAIDALRQMRVNPAEVTIQFLDEQVTAQRQTLTAAREALQKFQLEHEISDLPREIAAAQDVQRSLEAERDRLRTEAMRAQALADSYQAQANEAQRRADERRSSINGATIISATAPITNTTLVVTPADAAASMRQIEALASRAQALQSKAQEQKALLAGHQAAIADYERILDERQQQIIYLLGLQDEYNTLVGVVTDAQGSYEFLLDKANEGHLKVAQGASTGYLKIENPPRLPQSPLPRNLKQLLVVGIFASLLLALLLAFLMAVIEQRAMAKPK
jgi:uncharacterized protein involved in exopolysaccharide biosynthesis